MASDDGRTRADAPLLRPSLKDVAAHAGFGLRTTKKVMSGRERVAEPTRQRILAAAAELGYRKNVIASALALAKRARIGLVYSELTKGYFPEVEQGFLRFADEYQDYGLDIEFAKGHDTSVEHQAEALEAMLADDSITGVILQPVSADGLDSCISRLTEAGKPVITFGSDAPASSRLAYIGPNAYKAGRIGAQILANYIGKRGVALVVSRGPEHMQTRERRHGFYDMLAEYYPEVEPTELVIEDPEATYAAIRAVVERQAIAAIFSTYADSSIAGQVLHDLARRDIVLVGFDTSEETLSLMQKGYIKIILEQNPADFSYRALKMMFDYKFFQQVPDPVVTTEVSILTSECLP